MTTPPSELDAALSRIGELERELRRWEVCARVACGARHPEQLIEIASELRARGEAETIDAIASRLGGYVSSRAWKNSGAKGRQEMKIKMFGKWAVGPVGRGSDDWQIVWLPLTKALPIEVAGKLDESQGTVAAQLLDERRVELEDADTIPAVVRETIAEAIAGLKNEQRNYMNMLRGVSTGACVRQDESSRKKLSLDVSDVLEATERKINP